MKRLLPPVMAFVVTVAVLVPSALSLSQHGDEKMYVWKAAYYGGLVARLDTHVGRGDSYMDPGWSPYAFWAFEQPLGSHWLYALVLGLTRSDPPRAPYSWTDASLQGPDTDIPAATLPVVRLAAVVFAAFGLAFVASRLGWHGFTASVLLLAIPHVREDLARSWAEGPMLLGLGLAVRTYGTRYFVPVCALAASLKMTALLLWPLATWQGTGRRLPHFSALGALVLTFTALHLPGVLFGGPYYVLYMVHFRMRHTLEMFAAPTGELGVGDATRWYVPFELAAILAICVLAPRVWHRLRPSVQSRPQQVREQIG